jgi:hypothetical protein
MSGSVAHSRRDVGDVLEQRRRELRLTGTLDLLLHPNYEDENHCAY